MKKTLIWKMVFAQLFLDVAPIEDRFFTGAENSKSAEMALRLEFRMAGAVGLEPATNGFGDRYSTETKVLTKILEKGTMIFEESYLYAIGIHQKMAVEFLFSQCN